MKKLILTLAVICLSISGMSRDKDFITYEEYGAKGNGKSDDQAAIVAAHKAANEKKLPVKAKKGRVYYIGGGDEVAIIKTNVDWNDARFIINDVDAKNPKMPIFRVESFKKPYSIDVSGPVKKGQTSLRVKLKGKSLVSIENKDRKVYIREGLNQNAGASQQEVLLVAANGDIDPSTAPVWDYDYLTKVKVYPIDEEPLTISGGAFTTIANQAESKYKYQKRGIEVARSNVFVENIVHSVEGELDHGAPYNSFLGFSYVEGIYVRNCVFTGRKIYITIGSAQKPVRMGTYDVNVNHSINVHLENCCQLNSIDDTDYWGVYTSNYCKNLSLSNCVFSRFDAHQGVSNVTLKNCVFGHQGARMVGFGTLTLENCTVNAPYLVSLRQDYGSSWEGDIIIRNCVIKPVAQNYSKISVITGQNAGTHDFGYECCLPDVDIDGLVIMDGSCTNPDYKGAALFENFKKDAPVEVKLNNVVMQSGKSIKACQNPELFKGLASF